MSNIDRRKFLKALGIGSTVGASAALSGGLASASQWPAQVNSSGGQPILQQEGSGEVEPWQQIDLDHKAKVDTFLANIGTDDIFWERPIEFTMDGDVKVFELTTEHVMWATEDGNERAAFAFNGMIPGRPSASLRETVCELSSITSWIRVPLSIGMVWMFLVTKMVLVMLIKNQFHLAKLIPMSSLLQIMVHICITHTIMRLNKLSVVFWVHLLLTQQILLMNPK